MSRNILSFIFILFFGLALAGCASHTTSQVPVKQHTSASTAKKYSKAQINAHIKAHVAEHNGDVAAANAHAAKFGGDHVKAHIAHHKGNVAEANEHAEEYSDK